MAGIPGVWRGSSAVKEQPNSPVFDNSSTGTRWTRVFKGKYETVLAAAPARQQAMAGIPGGYFVDTVRVEKNPGGTGTMTVTLTPSPPSGYDDNTSVMEVEWVEVQKKLEVHPMFNEVTSQSSHPNAGKYELSNTDWNNIEEWKAQTDANTRDAKYQAMSANAQAFAGRIMKGQDSYVHYAPQVMVTTKKTSRPISSECGLISDPPDAGKVPGYAYLATSDRATQSGRGWCRVQGYTGADEIDTEVYPFAT